MRETYSRDFFSESTYYLEHGWTIEEINLYFPIIESLNDSEFRVLHEFCSIKMFSPDEIIDREQAIHVLVNPNDTPKNLLVEGLRKLGKI